MVLSFISLNQSINYIISIIQNAYSILALKFIVNHRTFKKSCEHLLFITAQN